MGLLVIKPGLFTTVQDLGRPGYREWGVPAGGAFDRSAHGLANALVGNRPADATLELTLLGGTYEARHSLALALAGAAVEARVEAVARGARGLRPPQSFTLAAGDRLVLGGMSRGARCYLAVAGGWHAPVVLGSRSSEQPLGAGDVLPAAAGTTAARRPAEPIVPDPSELCLRVLDGPDTSLLDEGDAWRNRRFRVAATANRMGIRLDGPRLEVRTDPERLSTPVAPGAVQVAGGQAIVLGVACGTMGGYPHVAQVISADMPRLAQLRPGDAVTLRRIGLAEARDLDRAASRDAIETARRIALLAADAFPDPPG